MSARQAQQSLDRLRRSLFVKETQALQKQHQKQLPAKVGNQVPSTDPPPWEETENRLAICTTALNFSPGRTQRYHQENNGDLAVTDVPQHQAVRTCRCFADDCHFYLESWPSSVTKK